MEEFNWEDGNEGMFDAVCCCFLFVEMIDAIQSNLVSTEGGGEAQGRVEWDAEEEPPKKEDTVSE